MEVLNSRKLLDCRKMPPKSKTKGKNKPESPMNIKTSPNQDKKGVTEKKKKHLTFFSWNCSRSSWIDEFKPTEDIVALQFSNGQSYKKVKEWANEYEYQEEFIFTGYNAILLKKDRGWKTVGDDVSNDLDPRIAHLKIQLENDTNVSINIYSAYLNATEIKKTGAESFYIKLNKRISASIKKEGVLLMASLGSAKVRPNALKLESKDSYIEFLEKKNFRSLICERALEDPEKLCTYREQREDNETNDPATSLIDYIFYSTKLEEYFENLRWKNPETVVKHGDGIGKGTQHLKIQGVFHNGGSIPYDLDGEGKKIKDISYEHCRAKGKACKNTKSHDKPIQYLKISNKKLEDDEDYFYVENKGIHFYIGKKYTKDLKEGKVKEIYKRIVTKDIPQTKVGEKKDEKVEEEEEKVNVDAIGTKKKETKKKANKK